MRPTPHRLRRSAASVAGIVALLGLVSACGTGLGAQTDQIYQASAGADARSDSMELHSVVAVENPDGTSTISAVLLNKAAEPDQLSAVTAATGDDQPVDLEFSDPIDLPTGELVRLGEEPEIALTGDTDTGDYVTLDVQFENAAPMQIDVPVVARDSEGTYDEVAEAPEPAQPQDDGPKGEAPKRQDNDAS